MARALIVGCGCRGRRLATELIADGWQVRGTTRSEAMLETIAATGADPVLADPDRVGTVLEVVDDVAVVYWVLGSATGAAGAVAAVHGARLERLLENLVDTPVRGFVYEGAGAVGAEALAAGAKLVGDAGKRWRIPVAVVKASPAEPGRWADEMKRAARALLALD